MKILLVNPSFKGGGITSYAHEVIRCFHKVSDFSVMVGDDSQNPIKEEGVKIYRVDSSDLSYKNVCKALDLINNTIKPDVIISSNSKLIAVLLPYLLDSIKVISVCHSTGSSETEISGYNHQYCDHIIALSGYAKEVIIKRHHMDANKVTSVPSQVAEEPDAEAIIKDKILNKRKRIVYLGGGNGIKSPDLVAKVLKKLIKTDLDFEFYWVGATMPPLHRFSLLKDIRQLIPADKRVVFTGKVSRKDALRYTSMADIYLLPSRREGCPISLLEAMRTGAIPIVAEYNISNKEIVNSANNGFVFNHRNVNEYVNVISNIITGAQDCSQLYRNSYEYYKANLTEDVWTKRMMEVVNLPADHEKRNAVITEKAIKISVKDLLRKGHFAEMKNVPRENILPGLSVNWQFILSKLGFNIITERMNRFVNDLKETFIYKYLRELFLKWFVTIAPEKEVDRCYYASLGKHCNLKDPKHLMEKVYWMELYTDVSLWTKCADKLRVREYVEECGLLNYMPRLYGSWEKADDVNFKELPNSFVIKANNGCGTVKVVKDKSQLDVEKLRKEMRQWLKIPFGYSNAQIHYTKIKPCLLAEEVLSNDYVELSPTSMADFKVWCINGNPQCIQITFNRTKGQHDVDVYDTNWNRMLDHLCSQAHKNEGLVFPKPDCLQEMLTIAKKLSEPFPEVRVDFYIVNKKPIIGELTFSAGYPAFTEEYYEELGSMIDLTKIKRIK